MDYLDSKKQTRERLILFIGYVLLAIAIGIASIILLYQAYGFGIGKNGTVIQDGLTFFSSHPSAAQIYLNSSRTPIATTNTRLVLPEGIYKARLVRAGYYDWQRTIELVGGSVEHFDYPFLIPQTINTNKLPAYASAPTLFIQSPDKRWLVVGKPGSFSDFDVYDLKNPTKPSVTLSLPSNLLTKATKSESWQLGEWADDNQHVLLNHAVDGKTEYILMDRANPLQSLNLTNTLSLSTEQLTLINKKFDQYYLYSPVNKVIQQTAPQSTDKTTILDHVMAYQAYGNNTILYVTDVGGASGKYLLKMRNSSQDYTIRSFPVAPNYVLALTQYSGTMYVAAGSSSGSKVYIYQDPVGQLSALPNQAPVPLQVLQVDQPSYISFSENAQFIMAENSNRFGVYDLVVNKGYNYTALHPLDNPVTHASWMDGDRLYYVSGGQVDLFDYDRTNEHQLMAASSQYLPVFAPDYKYIYALNQTAAGQFDLTQTWLLAPHDR